MQLSFALGLAALLALSPMALAVPAGDPPPRCLTLSDGWLLQPDPQGVGWYALLLPADRVAAEAWQRLRFGRANHRATVWIDGQKAGDSQIGYVPFEIAASPWLKPGRTAWIVVRVENGARYDWLPGLTTVE